MKRQHNSIWNWRSLGSCLLLAGSLAGCGQEAEQLAKETIAEVVSYKDPTVALEKLQEAEMALRQICSSSGSECAGPVAQLIEAQRRMVGELVQLGNTGAIREIFSRGSLMSMQEELAPMVLDMAQQSNDPNIMAVAAKVLGNDHFGQQDIKRQIEYLIKSWRLGDVQASGELAGVLDKIGDDRNAYLWALRCVGECRQQQIELAMLERKLGIAKMEAIQALATNKNVVSVGSSP